MACSWLSTPRFITFTDKAMRLAQIRIEDLDTMVPKLCDKNDYHYDELLHHMHSKIVVVEIPWSQQQLQRHPLLSSLVGNF